MLSASEPPSAPVVSIAEISRKKTGLQKADLLNQYLAEVRRYPLLSPEEEHKLAVRYREEDDQDAGRQLITSNLRLVVKMAFKYHSQWSNVLDLIQQGNIGLLQALKKYDPFNATNTRFSSYAAYWIRSCIYNYIKDNYRIVRLGSTRHGRKLFDNLRKERENLLSQGIMPSTKALSESLEIPEEEIVMFSQHFNNPALSFDSKNSDDDSRPLEETVASAQFDNPEDDNINKELSNQLKEKLSIFASFLTDQREKSIWERRMMTESPCSLKELGEQYGVSKERIRQIESKIKLRLRSFLEEELGSDLEFDFKFS